MIPPGTVLHNQMQQGKFLPMKPAEIMDELQLFIEDTSDELHDCIFRSNHASNYLPIKGVLAEDKQHILNQISSAISSPASLRPESWRGL